METILVPTDFSPVASNAIDYAMRLAVFFNTRIILLNAYFPVTPVNPYPMPPTNFEAGYSVDIDLKQKDVIIERLNSVKNGICKKLERNFDIECVAEIGLPDEVIDAVAKEQNVDLIVMGIVGEAGRIKEHLIGSTALKVARNQGIPTFIIPENVHYKRIRKISFACDLNKTEETDLVYVAKFFGKVFDAELEVVNVEKPEELTPVEKTMTNLFMESKLKTIKHEITHLEGRNVARELEDYFRANPTDVILLNPKRHNVFYYLFNQSITKELAFHAHLPLLTIK